MLEIYNLLNVSMRTNSILHSFSAGILSDPVTLEIYSSFNSLRTPLVSTVTVGISGKDES